MGGRAAQETICGHMGMVAAAWNDMSSGIGGCMLAAQPLTNLLLMNHAPAYNCTCIKNDAILRGGSRNNE